MGARVGIFDVYRICRIKFDPVQNGKGNHSYILASLASWSPMMCGRAFFYFSWWIGCWLIALKGQIDSKFLRLQETNEMGECSHLCCWSIEFPPHQCRPLHSHIEAKQSIGGISLGRWNNRDSNTNRSLITSFKTIATMFDWLDFDAVRKG